jgi:hypothetical protein
LLPATFQTNINRIESLYLQRHLAGSQYQLLLAMNVQNHDGEEITPPSSIHPGPLTPPPTDEKQARDIKYILRQIAKYRSGDTRQTIHKVNKIVWAAVSPLLLRDDKLQYARYLSSQGCGYVMLMSKHSFDYFPSIERLVLRMPTKVHEQFSRSLSGRVSEQLRLLSLGSGSAAHFAKDIRDVGSATIRPLDPEYGTHDPDGSFQHLKSRSPTVIFEVAHSQTGGKLRTLAEEYIFGSDLEVRVVVGFDIEYNKSKRASFSIWRASVQSPDGDEVWVVKPTVANQVILTEPIALPAADIAQIFRYDDGKPNLDQDAGVHLRLEDFADRTTCQQFKDIDRDIFISCSELYQYLEEAEATTKIAESTKLVRNSQLRKRRRTPTPEEQLNDRDEDAFARDEAHAIKRRELDDSSYKESSSECA